MCVGGEMNEDTLSSYQLSCLSSANKIRNLHQPQSRLLRENTHVEALLLVCRGAPLFVATCFGSLPTCVSRSKETHIHSLTYIVTNSDNGVSAIQQSTRKEVCAIEFERTATPFSMPSSSLLALLFPFFLIGDVSIITCCFCVLYVSDFRSILFISLSRRAYMYNCVEAYLYRRLPLPLSFCIYIPIYPSSSFLFSLSSWYFSRTHFTSPAALFLLERASDRGEIYMIWGSEGGRDGVLRGLIRRMWCFGYGIRRVEI